MFSFFFFSGLETPSVVVAFLPSLGWNDLRKKKDRYEQTESEG